MYRVGQEMEPPILDLQPWQYFDLIGGTSVGGCIEFKFALIIVADMQDRLEGQSREFDAFAQFGAFSPIRCFFPNSMLFPN